LPTWVDGIRHRLAATPFGSSCAVILDPSLHKVDELIHFGRRMRAIARQSALGGIALSLAGMLAASFGYLPPVAGAIGQEAIDLLAVLNAIRVAMPFGEQSDMGEEGRGSRIARPRS
jgi:hypothetical protein